MIVKKVNYKEVRVCYTDYGETTGRSETERGLPTAVMLHGYLETRAIWEPFIPFLTERCRVICIDLPGHGESGVWGNRHTMDDLAGSVREVLRTEKLERILLVGHSMGGYVTMAFAENHPEYLSGYVLFHSTCFADSEEKKVNRDREISLVLCKKKRQIVNVNIPKAFAKLNVDRLKEQVVRARQIALQNPDQGIVAILNGMKERPDRTHVLEDPGVPLLLIGGMKDNYIPVEVFDRLAGIAPHASVVKLKESGHMGFVEEPELSAGAILDFIKKIPDQE